MGFRLSWVVLGSVGCGVPTGGVSSVELEELGGELPPTVAPPALTLAPVEATVHRGDDAVLVADAPELSAVGTPAMLMASEAECTGCYCPPVLGGTCVDLDPATVRFVTGSVVEDAGGERAVQFTAPSDATTPDTLVYQAALLVPGQAILTNTASVDFTSTCAQPAGRYLPFLSVGTSPGAGGVAMADIDADGRDDVLLVTSSAVEVYPGHGGPASSYSWGGSGYAMLTAGDFDHDGVPDLAVSSWSEPSVYVLLATTSGGAWTGFAAPSHLSVGASGGLTDVETADFDGDGVLDLVVAMSKWGTWDPARVMFGNGDGTFRPGAEYTFESGAGDGNAYTMRVADMDGDGDVDIVGAVDDQDAVVVLWNDGAGRFPTRTATEVEMNGSFIAVGDMDHEGSIDVVVSHSSEISILLNDGAGMLSPSLVAEADGSGDVAIGDVDLDGFNDIIMTSWYGGSTGLIVARGDGAGGLLGQVDYDSEGQPFNLAIGDVNGDGRLDAASTADYDLNLYLSVCDEEAPGAEEDPPEVYDPYGDPDLDGVVNADDNCPDAHNPDQMDSTGDGHGDACGGVLVDEDFDGALQPSVWDKALWSASLSTDQAVSGDTSVAVTRYTGIRTVDLSLASCSSNSLAYRYAIKDGPAAPIDTDRLDVQFSFDKGFKSKFEYGDGTVHPWQFREGTATGKDAATEVHIVFHWYSSSSIYLSGGTFFLDDILVMCDEDEDGLGDRDEYEAGTDLLNPDTDGDLVWDYDEILAGTDPLDSSSY